jgi:mannose-6-phosphate isomerase-like protein (cupin superfamily)
MDSTTESAAKPSDPIMRPPGDGTTVEALGARVTLKALAEQTGGRYGCLEYVAPPGFRGPVVHTHPATDEVFYVLEGQFTIRVGDREVQAPAGTLVHVPGHLAHTFANPGQTQARFLGFLVPGGMEHLFFELPEIIARHGYPPPPPVMAELSRKYGVQAVDH